MYSYLSYSVEDLFVMYALYIQELKWIRSGDILIEYKHAVVIFESIII